MAPWTSPASPEQGDPSRRRPAPRYAVPQASITRPARGLDLEPVAGRTRAVTERSSRRPRRGGRDDPRQGRVGVESQARASVSTAPSCGAGVADDHDCPAVLDGRPSAMKRASSSTTAVAGRRRTPPPGPSPRSTGVTRHFWECLRRPVKGIAQATSNGGFLTVESSGLSPTDGVEDVASSSTPSTSRVPGGPRRRWRRRCTGTPAGSTRSRPGRRRAPGCPRGRSRTGATTTSGRAAWTSSQVTRRDFSPRRAQQRTPPAASIISGIPVPGANGGSVHSRNITRGRSQPARARRTLPGGPAGPHQVRASASWPVALPRVPIEANTSSSVRVDG